MQDLDRAHERDRVPLQSLEGQHPNTAVRRPMYATEQNGAGPGGTLELEFESSEFARSGRLSRSPPTPTAGPCDGTGPLAGVSCKRAIFRLDNSGDVGIDQHTRRD
jgi:hypothetical protein